MALKRKSIEVDDKAWERLKIMARQMKVRHSLLLNALIKFATGTPPSDSLEAAMIVRMREYLLKIGNKK